MSRRERRRAAALTAAVAQLPGQQQAVFRAVGIEGATYTDTAKRLGMAAAEVERQLAAALVALDTALALPPPQGLRQWLARRFGPGPSG